MRRITLALVLVCVFGVGLLGGFANNTAKATTVCTFMACESDPKYGLVRWVCCRDTRTNQVSCAKTTEGCQWPTLLFY